MKILGISFGGKNGANDSMCKEALMGAKEQGAEVTFVHMLDWNIKPCTGCVACSRALVTGGGNLCSIKDELEDLIELILDADGIFISTPIFEKGATGLFHTLNDRLGPRADKGMNMVGMKIAQEGHGKPVDPRWIKDKTVSFLAIGGSDWSTVVQTATGMLALPFGWKIIDNKCYSWSKNIIMEDDKVAAVHQMGVELAKATADIENAKYLGEKGVCPHCHCRNFYIIPDTQKAICVLCGIEGELVAKDGKLTFEFPESQIEHAHDTLSGKFIHADDIRVNEMQNMENRKTDKYKNAVDKYKSFLEPIAPPSKR
ncbi:MAG: flavodoxin family protein [Clostridiales bacterium]|nr:flavodoxin family protein [Clostridiales bacterium]